MNRSVFEGCKIYFHPGRLGKKRLDLLVKLVLDNGGEVCSTVQDDFVTHIVMEESCDISPEQWEEWCQIASVVGTKWLSQSLKDKKCHNACPFFITNCGLKRCATDEDITHAQKYLFQSKKEDTVEEEEQEKTTKAEEHEKYICTQASTSGGVFIRNQAVIIGLQKLAETYRRQGDSWRSYGYEKAICAIRRMEKDINSYEEVVGIEGIGSKMAEKVMEIITTGKLRKIEEVCNDEKSKIFELFSNVWGAGPSTVDAWYTQVSEAAHSIDPLLNIIICGSYRRGKATCGDADIVIIRPDNMESRVILSELLKKLRNAGFITDDLISSETSGTQRKYLGICKLPGENRKHRRLDIFLVPKSESATAIMHYTGSALFNRSIRLLAAQKGMHLSEYSLSIVVAKQGLDAQHSVGAILDTPTEESIFNHLGIKYRSAEERDH